MKHNIYVSSVAFQSSSPEEILEICEVNNFNLEFSSGMPYRKEMENLYLNAQIAKMPHNYFPAPEIPFVLNLASTDEAIRKLSIDHCKKSLNLAKESNSPFFAAHAGFCIDPKPWELGGKISQPMRFVKERNKELFVDSIHQILKVADELEIDFLIENNVLAPFNYINEKNPLLCCDSKELNWLTKTVRSTNFGLLLDTAHLKVSCLSLQKDLIDEFLKISPFVKAFHHSDNNGLEDTNDPLHKDYWFKEVAEKFKNHVHVLEVKNLTLRQIRQQLQILATLLGESPQQMNSLGEP